MASNEYAFPVNIPVEDLIDDIMASLKARGIAVQSVIPELAQLKTDGDSTRPNRLVVGLQIHFTGRDEVDVV